MHKALLISSLVLATLLIRPSNAEAVFPGYNGKIVFASERDGNREIYSMNADGTNQLRLTNNPASDSTPFWSPDGSKIAFSSVRSGNNEIYVMNADGSGVINITNNVATDSNPVWSPNGSKLAFSSTRAVTAAEIFVMEADGSNPVRLTTNTTTDAPASWSPDGSKISFQAARDGNNEIYVMNADGTGQTNLSNSPLSNEFTPHWSPNGSKIVFQSNRDGNDEVYIMNADGSSQTRLTNMAGSDHQPHFSPDGTKIVFDSQRDAGIYEIYVMNVDGSQQTHLTNTGQLNALPDWQRFANTPPHTTLDSLVTSHNTVGAVNVLLNDTDEQTLSSANLTITVLPAHGISSINTTDGTIDYTPTTGYYGTDQLSYQICDSFILDQKCATGVLGITVTVNQAPALTLSSIGPVQIIDGTQTYQFTGHRPTFVGTADSGSVVKVEIHSDPLILTTTADSLGNWSVTPDQDLPNGQHTISITATLNGQSSVLADYILNINTGLAETGMPMWPLIIIGLCVYIATWLLYRRRTTNLPR